MSIPGNVTVAYGHGLAHILPIPAWYWHAGTGPVQAAPYQPTGFLQMKGIKGSCHDVTLNIFSSGDIFQHSYQIASEFGEHTKLLKQRHNFGRVLFQGNNRVTLNKINNMSKQ